MPRPMRSACISAFVGAIATLLLVAIPRAAAVQTFPDPFGGQGTFVDLPSGSTGQDVGDVFMLWPEEFHDSLIHELYDLRKAR